MGGGGGGEGQGQGQFSGVLIFLSPLGCVRFFLAGNNLHENFLTSKFNLYSRKQLLDFIL